VITRTKIFNDLDVSPVEKVSPERLLSDKVSLPGSCSRCGKTISGGSDLRFQDTLTNITNIILLIFIIFVIFVKIPKEERGKFQ